MCRGRGSTPRIQNAVQGEGPGPDGPDRGDGVASNGLWTADPGPQWTLAPRTACKNGLRAAERCRNDASTTPLFPPGRHPDPSSPSSFLIPSRQCLGCSLRPDDMAIRNGFHRPPASTLDSQPTVLRRATPARARATAPPAALHKVSQRQRLFRWRPCSLFPRTAIWKGRDKTWWSWRSGWGGPGTGGVDGDAASVPDVHALPGPSALGPITGAVSGAIEHLVSRDEAQASSSTEVWSLPSAHLALLPSAPDPPLDRMPRTAAAISLFVATLRWSRCPATPTTTRPQPSSMFPNQPPCPRHGRWPRRGCKVLLRCSRRITSMDHRGTDSSSPPSRRDVRAMAIAPSDECESMLFSALGAK